MKKIIASLSVLALVIMTNSCKKETEKPQWEVEVKNPIAKVDMVDISGKFYDENYPLEDFKKEYPWFQGSVADKDFAERRKDEHEVAIYKEAISKIDVNKLNKDLANLFSHIKTYFPSFKAPKVFLYSTAVYYDSILNPIFYKPEENFLFIDISAFMGDKNKAYSGIDFYIQKSMNPSNIVPKVSLSFAEQMVQRRPTEQKFIDELVYNGKIQILQDIFLPDTPDFLKMNYTKEQEEWNIANEFNIWNYFVENDYLFNSDPELASRFIQPGPFSKFYTEIDNESSPQVGVWIGWQICRDYLAKNPNVKIPEFLKKNATEIFNASGYKPKEIK
ncbi:gliding motility protein GldB [Chryseobacterium sp. POL2]|uniref:gliding motility lipoprotein GldB n=1 Tax=Chryseobacterium sp. POL2 TaxID=2713414 RepID=UPI0013E19786|nr:gliding motility protein GldB [Chryseobacterium sp. POL2]QIG90866.1 gliding motility protein GldB [Chryseobacterium sp. POL2]